MTVADTEMIRKAFERNARTVALRPAVGKSTGRTTIRVRDGTTCEIENGPWRFTADVGTAQGGNDSGPGPSVLERAALGRCLAIGSATWAAYLGVPIEHLEVEVESACSTKPTGTAPPSIIFAGRFPSNVRLRF